VDRVVAVAVRVVVIRLQLVPQRLALLANLLLANLSGLKDAFDFLGEPDLHAREDALAWEFRDPVRQRVWMHRVSFVV